MSYSRQCGVPIAACGADTCHCVPVDPDAELGRENAACDFGDDFPCCANTDIAIGHNGQAVETVTTYTNPMQRTHNESRADA